MSLPFNSGNNGIIQKIERTIYGQDAVGRISGNSTLLAQWTADVNLALDKAFAIIFRADGTWQFDDSNHTTYPTITTNLVDGQRAYDFIEDSAGNLLLEIGDVYILNDTRYEKIEPIDETNDSGFYDGANAEGTPYRYGKKGSGIFLDPIPSANVTAGLKVEVSREGSYFTTSDSTKSPGIAGLFHDYLYVEPCFNYAVDNSLASVQGLQLRKMQLEHDLKAFYGKRSKDEAPVMRPKKIKYI